MALSGFPLTTKYANGDTVYIFHEGRLITALIVEWRVVVDDPLGDDAGRQVTYYKFYEKNVELPEFAVFASPNHALSYAKNDIYNRSIASGTGGDLIFGQVGRSTTTTPDFGTWTDLAGLILINVDFTISDDDPETPADYIIDWANCVFDNTNLRLSTLPAVVDTKAEFRAGVRSYDAETTIWTDGSPIGRP